MNLFQKINKKAILKNKEKTEMTIIFFLCSLVFMLSLVSGTVLAQYQRRGGNDHPFFPAGNVLAAQSWEEEGKGENISAEEQEKISKSMLGVAGSVKESAQAETAKRLARRRIVISPPVPRGPAPTGPTRQGPGGRRVCALKNDHPHGGGSPHVDEDCCPDPDEYANPRCYYTPGQMGILKRKVK